MPRCALADVLVLMAGAAQKNRLSSAVVSENDILSTKIIIIMIIIIHIHIYIYIYIYRCMDILPIRITNYCIV